jgi:hypothetical protein
MVQKLFRRASVLVLLTVALSGLPSAVAAPEPARREPEISVVASGLNNPRGLSFGPEGGLYVAEAGRGGTGPCVEHPVLTTACAGRTGAVTRVWHGDQERVVKGLPSIATPSGVEAFGPHDVAVFGDGTIDVSVGLTLTPDVRVQYGPKGARLGHLIRIDEDGARSSLADIAAYEAAANPDGGPVDSNPFGLLKHGVDRVVTDAGGNTVLSVDSGGTVSTLAVFPNRTVDFQGQPIPMHAVPTTVVRGPDGAYYVGQLTGFPFPIGGARVYRVEPGGDPEIYARGFTNIIDIAFGVNGSLYVLEIAHNSLLAESPEGALIKVSPDGDRRVIADGLFFPGGVALGPGRNIYVTNCGICPGDGEVWRISLRG